MYTYPLEWKGVKAVIFDVDGTLYSQRSLRAFVLKDVMLQCLFQPWRFRDVLILKKYRDIREKMKGFARKDIESYLYNETAKSLRMRTEDVKGRNRTLDVQASLALYEEMPLSRGRLFLSIPSAERD